MPRQGVEPAPQIRERAARTGFAMHRRARDRAGCALACLEHRREGRVIARLTLRAFAVPSRPQRGSAGHV
jgi:hypothetical protein